MNVNLHTHSMRSTLSHVTEASVLAVERCYKHLVRQTFFEVRIVNASANTRDNDVKFKHIIEHALSCTLEDDGEDVSSCVGSRFGTIHEVLTWGK